jgi:hypothetical protein
MTQHLIRTGALAAVLVVAATGIPAAAQVQTQVCENQQSMEQLMDSDGAMVPDDCRAAAITRFERDAGDVCVLDLSGAEGGVLDEVLAVARTDQWWIACDSLAEIAEPQTP